MRDGGFRSGKSTKGEMETVELEVPEKNLLDRERTTHTKESISTGAP